MRIIGMTNKTTKSGAKRAALDGECLMQRDARRQRAGGRAHHIDTVSEIPARLDRVVPQRRRQLATQLADMAFHDAFLNLIVEDAIRRREHLLLGDPFATMQNEKLENTSFASRPASSCPCRFQPSDL